MLSRTLAEIDADIEDVRQAIKRTLVAYKRADPRVVLDHAFLATMPNGKRHIAERKDLSDPRSKIKALYGPAIVSMAKNDGVADKVRKRGEQVFEERLISNLNLLLFGSRKL